MWQEAEQRTRDGYKETEQAGWEAEASAWAGRGRAGVRGVGHRPRLRQRLQREAEATTRKTVVRAVFKAVAGQTKISWGLSVDHKRQCTRSP